MNDQLKTIPPWLWRERKDEFKANSHRALLDKMTIRPDPVHVAMIKHPGMVELPLMHFLTYALAQIHAMQRDIEMLQMRTGLCDLPEPPPGENAVTERDL